VSEPWELSVRELMAAYRALEVSPLEVLDVLAARIEAVDPGLNAFTTLSFERGRDKAARLTELYARRAPVGELAGIPFAAKDGLIWPPPGGAQAETDPTSMAPGEPTVLAVDRGVDPVEDWKAVSGAIHYNDVDRALWETTFESTATAGATRLR